MNGEGQNLIPLSCEKINPCGHFTCYEKRTSSRATDTGGEDGLWGLMRVRSLIKDKKSETGRILHLKSEIGRS